MRPKATRSSGSGWTVVDHRYFSESNVSGVAGSALRQSVQYKVRIRREVCNNGFKDCTAFYQNAYVRVSWAAVAVAVPNKNDDPTSPTLNIPLSTVGCSATLGTARWGFTKTANGELSYSRPISVPKFTTEVCKALKAATRTNTYNIFGESDW